MTHCRFCNSPVVFATTKTGKKMPVDPTPGYKGNVRLSQLRDGSYVAEVLPKGSPPSDDRHTSHMWTCPRRGV